MGVTEKISAMWSLKMAWAVALVLYGSCWFLPVVDFMGKISVFEGTRIAHEGFWNLMTEGHSIGSLADVFTFFFFSIGWLGNELFVLGIVAVLLKWPRAALRAFACSLSIMISWQIVFWDRFPFLIGYWFWVTAGAIALWLAATRFARETERRAGAVLAEPITLAVIFVPILNAAITGAIPD